MASFSNENYPNLELIGYKFKEELKRNPDWVDRYRLLKDGTNNIVPEIELEVFPQIWGSTCTAFDVNSNGVACIGGCAMTKAYTTVVHELTTNYYGVFIGNTPCYMVIDAKEEFFEDLRNRNIAPRSEAQVRY